MNSSTGIVICHKNLAESLLQTAKAILGHTEGLFAFSNEKYSSQELFKIIEEHLKEKATDKNPVIMTDLKGGNCWATGKIILKKYPDSVLITGVNLPMILSFLTKREKLSFTELSETLQNDAVRGISVDKK